MKSLLHSFLFVAAGSFLFAACAPEERPAVEEPDAAEPAEEAEPDVATAEVTEEDGVLTVTIQTDDTMQFRQERFVVPAGEEIRLILTHEGDLPAEAMGHNLVVLQQGVDMMDFAQDAARAAATDFIPEERADDMVVYTELIGGGETTETTFTAPEETGDYEYVCTFTGHAQAGMTGVMVVE